MFLKTPWYHGWNIVGVCVMLQMAALGLMANCFSFFLAAWLGEFDVTISSLVLGIALFSITCAFLAPLAGWSLDRIPATRVIGVAFVGMILAHFLIAMVTQGWQIVAIYALVLPVTVSFTSGIPAQTLVARWVVRGRGLAFSISALGLVVAGVVYPPTVVHLIESVGWRVTWCIFGVAHLLIVGGAAFLILRERPAPDELGYYVPSEREEEEETTVSAPQMPRSKRFAQSLRGRTSGFYVRCLRQPFLPAVPLPAVSTLL